MQRQLVEWTAEVHRLQSEIQRAMEDTTKKQEKTDQRRNDSYAGPRCNVNLFGSCNMSSKYCLIFDKTSTPLSFSITTKHLVSQEGRTPDSQTYTGGQKEKQSVKAKRK